VKLAGEDSLLHLYDYCRGKSVDPVTVWSQCLAVAPDAYYRIQLDSSSNTMYICYLESESIRINPVEDDDNDGCVGMDEDAMNNDVRTPDCVAMDNDPWNGDDASPLEVKRARLA
jgi:hypothetical protein